MLPKGVRGNKRRKEDQLKIMNEIRKYLTIKNDYATELDLDKKQTSYDDLLDALRLALRGYNFE